MAGIFAQPWRQATGLADYQVPLAPIFTAPRPSFRAPQPYQDNSGIGVDGSYGGQNTWSPGQGDGGSSTYNDPVTGNAYHDPKTMEGPQYMGGNYTRAGDTGEEGSGWNVPRPGYASLKDWWDNMGTGPNGLLGNLSGGSPTMMLLAALKNTFGSKSLDTGNLITQFDGYGRPIGGGQGLGMGGGDTGSADEYAAALQNAIDRMNLSAGTDSTQTPGHLNTNILNDLGIIQQQQLGPLPDVPNFALNQPTFTNPNAATSIAQPGAAPQIAGIFQDAARSAAQDWGGGGNDPQQEASADPGYSSYQDYVDSGGGGDGGWSWVDDQGNWSYGT